MNSMCVIITTLLFNTCYGGRGVATKYGDPTTGLRCNAYNVVPQNSFPYGNFAATGSYLWNYGYECGACYEVICMWPNHDGDCQCNGQTVKVQVMDNCDECLTSRPDVHLDLSTKAFDSISTGSSCGKIVVDYWRTDCDYNTNIKVRTQGSTSSQIDAHHSVILYISDVDKRGSIHGVELISRDGNWFKCEITNENYWLCNGGAPLTTDYPYDVKFIDDQGTVLYAYDLITSFEQGKVYDTGVNY